MATLTIGRWSWVGGGLLVLVFAGCGGDVTPASVEAEIEAFTQARLDAAENERMRTWSTSDAKADAIEKRIDSLPEEKQAELRKKLEVARSITPLSERANHAKAASTVKMLDDALFCYFLDNNVHPDTLETLTVPDRFGKIYLKKEALTPPWPGVEYKIDPKGPNHAAMGEARPDIFIVHPTGRYMIGNWKTGKIPVKK